ncbi:TonB-dependent receptor [Spirosoma montaniterrae]|uniref:SusC/RagA family TonB-linked outer membrane protein n=1 Tax=Spirosoma montaniterrae TaxID=1178516 RepID=UPI0030015E93
MKRTLPVLLLSWFLCITAFAQDRRLTGRVLDGNDNSPLPGANVVIKGTQTGVVTDANGQFTLQLPAGRTVLTVSAIGFATQEATIGNQSDLAITLTPDIKTLSEVVVTGYGTQSKKDITGAVASIDSKALLAVPITNAAQGLQGRIAGVNVSNDNSPGGGIMVRIRGFGTINDNTPLYVIDGVPTQGNLNTINPNDIESMQILKDASAASIYGSRAGNGVVIITTKKGKAGKPRLTYDAYYGQQSAWKFLDLLNTQEYANLVWEAGINSLNPLRNGVPQPGTNGQLTYPRHAQFGNGARPVIPYWILPAGSTDPNDPRAADALYNNTPTARNLITRANQEGTDWYDVIFNPAPIQNHQIGVSGATEAARYAMSLNYFDQKGIMEYTSYKRYALRANTEFNVTKRVRIGENFQVSYGERIGQPNGNQNEANPVSFAYRIQPIIPVYDIRNYFAGTSGADLDNARNPLADLWRNKDNKEREIRLFGNAYADFDILKNLTFRTSFGVDYNLFNVRRYRAIDVESNEQAGSNSLIQENRYDYTWTWYNTLTYNMTIANRHRFNVILGTEAIKSFGEGFLAERQGFASDDLTNRYLFAGRNIIRADGRPFVDYRLASEFGRINYALDDKYLVDFTLRRDRSSRFAPNFRTAIFPAASVGWRVSREGFLSRLSWLTDAKLRAGWGRTGNQSIGDYNFATQYASSPESSFYDLTGSRTSSFQGYELAQFGNENARWETTTSTNIGLDATLLKGRLDLNFDWFNRRTTDMLFPVEVQFTQGVATNPFQNIGEMTNKGVELGLNYNDKALRGNLTYGIGVNFSTYRNLVTRTNGDPATQFFGFSNLRLPTGTVSVTQQGFPLASFFGYFVDGIFQSDEEGAAAPRQFDGVTNRAGNFRFRDINNDGLITAADRTIIGNPHPDFMYGFNVNVGYKNFRLDLLGQGVQGNQIFNYVKYWTDFPTFAGNRSRRMLEQSWRPGSTNAVLPLPRSSDNINSNPSTYFLENGSFLRLRNIQLTYTLPKTVFSRLNLSNANVYVQAQNWLTFTKYSGLDPEINLRSSSGIGQDRQLGVDEGAYPASRALLVGLSLGF